LTKSDGVAKNIGPQSGARRERKRVIHAGVKIGRPVPRRGFAFDFGSGMNSKNRPLSPISLRPCPDACIGDGDINPSTGGIGIRGFRPRTLEQRVELRAIGREIHPAMNQQFKRGRMKTIAAAIRRVANRRSRKITSQLGVRRSPGRPDRSQPPRPPRPSFPSPRSRRVPAAGKVKGRAQAGAREAAMRRESPAQTPSASRVSFGAASEQEDFSAHDAGLPGCWGNVMDQ